MKALALSIFHQISEAYIMLRSIFSLSAVRTLKKEMQSNKMVPGFRTATIESLKYKVSSMNYQ